MSEACGLEQAEKELRESGSLSEESYQQVLPLVEEKRKSIQPEKLVEADFDRQEFLDCITERKESCESHSNALDSIEGKLSDARFDYDALARDGYMDRIFRYEERMHKQIDWAVERLLANQERR